MSKKNSFLSIKCKSTACLFNWYIKMNDIIESIAFFEKVYRHKQIAKDIGIEFISKSTKNDVMQFECDVRIVISS